MEEHSVNCKLGYIETEYFGGIGGQGAVFYEDGKMTIAPTWEDGFSGTINRILSELGVKIIGYEDEFESIGLHRFRSMKQVK